MAARTLGRVAQARKGAAHDRQPGTKFGWHTQPRSDLARFWILSGASAMPTKLTLHVVSTIAAIAIAIPAIAITIPAVAQQATPPPAPVQKAEPTKPVAKVEKKSQGART